MNKLSIRFMSYITIIIVLILGFSLAWNNQLQKQQALEELKEKSSIIAKQFLATRDFMAGKQDIINYDSKGNFEFKHLNPARVGKGVGDIFAQYSDYRIKQTRLKVRNSENAPDKFEVEVLNKFSTANAPKEYWGVDTINGTKVFRYMIPLYFDEPCLQCHGEPKGEIDISGYPKEGYKKGAYGGAISVITPMNNYLANMRTNLINQLIFTTILLFVILAAIDLLIRNLIANPLRHLASLTNKLGQGQLTVDLSNFKAHGEIKSLGYDFSLMATQLNDLYKNLEKKVTARTFLLSEANELLEQQRGELVKYNEELIKANQLKSEFLANISHELKTPLTAILAFTELLLAEIPGKINKLQAENLQDILDSSKRLLVMINDLLDLAKIEAGRIKLNPILSDLSEIIIEVERNLTPLADKKMLTISSEISPDIPLLMLDPERIRQILLNLVGNAIKFNPEKGNITIKAELDLTDNQEKVLVTVCDTGIGISTDDIDKIFEKFHQVDSSLSRQYKGSGLGLTLAKTFTEMHGGNIWATSRLNQGSCFYFTLPINNQNGGNDK